MNSNNCLLETKGTDRRTLHRLTSPYRNTEGRVDSRNTERRVDSEDQGTLRVQFP